MNYISKDKKNNNIMDHVAKVVSAYVSNHSLEKEEVTQLMEQVHNTFMQLHNLNNPPSAKIKPAVDIEISICPDHIVCLEDGKKLKLLKRHLRSKYNLSPEEYRQKWGLPNDYPMVAPNYATKRSKLAKASGLGAKPTKNKK